MWARALFVAFSRRGLPALSARGAIVLGVAAGACLACGLDEAGLAPADAGADVPLVDAPDDPVPFVCVDAGEPSCATAAAAAFRAPALFSADGTAACPAGFTPHDLVYAQHAPACECSCGQGPSPACDTSQATLHNGATDCSLGTETVTTSCNGSVAFSYTGTMAAADPPAVVGGCTGGTSLPPQPTLTDVRLCVPDCPTDERMCQPAAGLKACVYVAGDVPSCPDGYPSGPFYVGKAPTITCDACSCTATGDCTGSTLHLYTVSTTCSTGDAPIPMDGVCRAAVAITAYSSKIDGKLKNGSYACKITAGAAHMTYASDDFTVCCP